MKLSIGLSALLIQIFSLLLLFLGYLSIHYFSNISIKLVWFLLIHSVVSALLNYLFSFDWWWSLIHLVFPLSIFFLLQFQISPNIYLIIFLLLSLVYWSIFKTRVPYYPSKSSLIPHLAKYFPENKNIQFIDVGSGLGGLLLKLSNLKENSHFYGIEIAPLTWLLSYLRGKFSGSNVKFRLGNLEKLDLSSFDIVFCYLSPAAMPLMWRKMQNEMKAGSILFSYEFIIPDSTPDILIEIEEDGSFLYGWCR